MPVNFPHWVLNGWTGRGVNEIYFRRQGAQKGSFILDCNRFFFPLDALQEWYKIYGKRGFVQYQRLLAGQEARANLRSIFELLHQKGCFSFLAVLKRMDRGNSGLLSFPREGYTMALDIPVDQKEVMPLLKQLDRMVMAHCGRVYLAKDARLDAETFRAMYPGFDRWLQVKRSIDPNNLFSSSLSRRLEMGAADA